MTNDHTALKTIVQGLTPIVADRLARHVSKYEISSDIQSVLAHAMS